MEQSPQKPLKPWTLLVIKVDGDDYAGWRANEIGEEELFRRALHGERMLQGRERGEAETNFQMATGAFATAEDRSEALAFVEDVVEHLDRDRGRHRACFARALTEAEAQLWAQNSKRYDDE